MTSRRVLLRLPLVTWKFSWGYNFCRMNLGKTRPAPSHNRTWQDTRTTQNRHLGRWAQGISGEGSWIVLSRQAVPRVKHDRASIPLVRLHRDLPEMLVTSQYHQARRSHKLDSKAWELLRNPLTPRPHLTPSRWFKNSQITGRRSLEGGGGRKVKANTCSCHRWKSIQRSALSRTLMSSPGCFLTLKTSSTGPAGSVGLLPAFGPGPVPTSSEAERDRLEAGRVTRGLHRFGGLESRQRPSSGSLGDCTEKWFRLRLT